MPWLCAIVHMITGSTAAPRCVCSSARGVVVRWDIILNTNNQDTITEGEDGIDDWCLVIGYSLKRLFPLNGCRRFRGNIIRYAIYAYNFIRNAGGYACERLYRKACEIRGHKIGGSNGSKHNEVSICSRIPLHPDRADVWKHREVLLYVFRLPCPYKRFAENSIRRAQYQKFLPGHLAEDSHCEPRTGKWLA